MNSMIPLDEAADFFLRLRGGEKTASVEETYVALAELSPEERAYAIKEAMEAGSSVEDLAAFLAVAAHGLDVEKTASVQLEKIQPGTHHVHSAGMLAALEQLPGRVFYSEFNKVAEDMMGAPMLPPTGQGKNTIVPPSPPALPPTAMGANKIAATDPIERGHANAEAEFEKRRHHKGERAGGHIGGAAGAAGGGALAHKLLGKHPGATVGGAALGYMAGKSLGKDVGHAVDDAKMKKHAEQMKRALEEMGISSPQGDPALAAPPAQMGQSDNSELDEYIQNEQAGQIGENEGAAEYYRERFQQAQQELQQMQQQMEQATQSTQALQEQVAGSDQQIQAAMQQAQMAQQSAMSNIQQAAQMATDATNQAMQFQSDAMQQKQLAAAMRMGVQQMKDGIMSAMAQDPTDQLAQQLQAPPPGSAGMVGGAPAPAQGQPAVDQNGQPIDPNAQAAAGGDPNAAPTPAADGGGGGGGEEKSEPKKEEKKDEGGGTTKVEVKQAAFSLPHAAAGGVIGAGIGAGYSHMSNDPLRQQVAQLEAMPEKGFGRAMQMASAKIRLAMGELAENHPGASTALAAAHGAVVGGMEGPEMAGDMKAIGQKMRGAYDNIRKAG